MVAILGNFVNRALVLTEKYFEGKVPAVSELTDYDRQTLKDFEDVKANVERLLDTYHFRDAQKEATWQIRNPGSWQRRICPVWQRS